MRRLTSLGMVVLLLFLFVDSQVLLPSRGAAAPQPLVSPLPVTCPEGALIRNLLFPPQMINTPAFPAWGFPAFSGDQALEPLPNSFDIVERPAWFDNIPITIRPFPRPSVGDGGPDDNHADMFVFFFPDGTPVPQLPLLEAVPLNATTSGINPIFDELDARAFSANWEIHVIRVTQNYIPNSIRSILDLGNPLWVLEDIQTNIFVTFPILPRQSTVPGLGLNNLSVQTGITQGRPVSFVAYDIWDFEYSKKPTYIFRKPSGEFVGNPVVSAIPGMPDYSSLWDVFIVDVPASFVADSLRSEDAVFARGLPIHHAFEAFFPVDAVDGMRTIFLDFMDVLTGDDGKFHKERFPKQVNSPAQPFDTDPRINLAIMGFTNNFTFNEVESPRIFFAPAVQDIEAALLEALLGFEPGFCNPIVLPPHIARQFLIVDSDSKVVHLQQTDVDNMPLAEIAARGQALFEREFLISEAAGPHSNAPSCAMCHGLPFNIAAEPITGGGGVRFRNALQPTDTPDPNKPGFSIKRSRATPHVFGAGILTQLALERGADGSDAKPFPHGWKGTAPHIRNFSAGPFQGELGLQAVEVVAGAAGVSLAEAATLDLDGDGATNEITVGDVTAVEVFITSLPRPFQINPGDSHVIRGRQAFDSVGCAACHTPVQTLQSTILDVTNPETSGVVRVPLGSPEVELYSDMTRHKMGALLAEPGPQGGIPADVFPTKALWGIADSGPWLHDGSANTLEEAIARHGGQGSEALPAVTAFNNLSGGARADLLSFLKSLKLPRPRDLQIAFFNSLTAGDREKLAPFLKSFLQGLEDGPQLFAWIVEPAPEGTSVVKGRIRVRISVTAEAGLGGVFLVIDGVTRIPVLYSFMTGFHETWIETTTLSEGDHTLSIDLSDNGGGRVQGITHAIITVDNIPDTSPRNFSSNWVGPQCVR